MKRISRAMPFCVCLVAIESAPLGMTSFPWVSFLDDGSQRLSNLDSRFLVALSSVLDLMLRAKDLSVAAIDGWG
jgi:hypothetical protein